MASLVDSHALSRAELNSLAWDAIGGEAGSWLDPFFKGPTPIGDLPGLGDRYRDLTLLGEGATARVYKALDTLLLRQVAIKVLKDADGPTLAEARAQAQIEHPNVCRIYEAGKGFLVMQLVEGPALSTLAPSLGRDDKVRIVRDLALGIHAAHQKGLVHLDLKLNNVLLETGEDGTIHPIVSDFGMVRTDVVDPSAGCPMGTPPYTSPEQLAGDLSRVGRGADVYALGVMLYVMLAGRIPFEAHDFPGLIEAMARQPAVPLTHRVPDLPRDLAAIVHRCMEKAPEDRYPTARDLAEDLDQFLRMGPVQAMGGTRLYRLGKWLRRNPSVQRAGAIGLVVLLAMAGLMVRHNRFVVQQSEWDHHFQKITEEIRTGIDQAYRLPAHNIEPELQKARGYLRVIEADLVQGGKPAKGPGLLALGQAHYFLDTKDPEAIRNMQAAWDHGYQVESVRSWLALALIHRARAGRRAGVLPERERAIAMRQEGEAALRYLDEARRLLEGRWNPDQTRLAHLVELAGATLRDPNDFDLPIRLALEFHNRFPNDLEGMLGEAEAVAGKADALARQAAGRSETHFPPSSAEADSLRQEAWAKLQQLQRIAPSHPGVYAAIVRWWMRQEPFPTDQTPSPWTLCVQARAWLDQGSVVNPNDLDLLFLRATLIASTELSCYLEKGWDLAPLNRELKGLVGLAGTVDPRRGRLLMVAAMASYPMRSWIYGRSDNSPLIETLQDLSRTPPAEGLAIPHSLVLQVGQAFLETGKDPGPLLGGLMAMEPDTAVRMNLMLARHAWLLGKDAHAFLGRANDMLLQVDAKGRSFGVLELSIRRLEAEIRSDEPSWDLLAQCIGRYEHASPVDVRPHVLWEARIALLRHLRAAGRPDLAQVRGLQEALAQPVIRDRYPTFLLQYFSAPVNLLAAEVAQEPRPALLEGLAACDGSLRSLDTWKAHGGFHRPAEIEAMALVIPARLLMVKGELLLALARLEPGPAQRTRLAREALAAVQESRKLNPLLQRLLAPLQAEAKALAQPDRTSHARP